MREAIAEYLPWGLSALSLAMAWLTGNRHRRVWLFGLFIQCLWLLWVCASAKWGFLPLTAWLFVIYARNHFKWEAERSAAEGRAFADAAKGPRRYTVEAVTKEDLKQMVAPGEDHRIYRKDLYRNGRLIASVGMEPAGSVADGLGRRAETPEEYFQECRREAAPWWRKDPWAPDPLGEAEGPNPLKAPPVLNRHGHEDHCSLMFPATLNTEDDRCDCRAKHDYPACGVHRGGRCSCDAGDRP